MAKTHCFNVTGGTTPSKLRDGHRVAQRWDLVDPKNEVGCLLDFAFILIIGYHVYQEETLEYI
jgi:hypothetical protein